MVVHSSVSIACDFPDFNPMRTIRAIASFSVTRPNGRLCAHGRDTDRRERRSTRPRDMQVSYAELSGGGAEQQYVSTTLTDERVVIET